MRTTITIDDALLEAVKAEARAEGVTLSGWIVDAVRAAMAVHGRSATTPFRLVTCGGQGPARGVDLDRTSALLAADDEDTWRRS